MTVYRYILAFACFFAGLCATPSVQACAAADNALAACQATYPNGVNGYFCRLDPDATAPDWDVQFWNGSQSGGDNASGVCPIIPPSNCPSGQVVTPGTNVLQSSTTGEMCTTGANSCEVSLKIGGANSGGSVLNGNACSATQGKTQPLPTPSETTNANGTKTYCDNLGNCVTSGPSPPSAPPSASSSANNSTDAASNTDTTPASSGSTSGSDGSGSGNGSGTGTGSTGSGNGTGAPASSSSTSTKCTDGVCDVGNADGQVGQLYTPSTDTPASVYASFKAEVSASPLISAATGFFSPPSASGTCPTWHIPGNKYWGEAGFDFTFFCSDGMLALLSLAGILVLAVGAFSAFRIALY